MKLLNNVLFITHHYLEGNSGGAYASCAYINAFSEISQDITLLYPSKKRTCTNRIQNKIKKIPIYYTKSKLGKFLDLLRGKVHRYSQIDNYIGNTKFDVVVFDTSVVSFKLIDLFKKRGCRTICIHHNYQYEYFRDNLNGPLKYITLYWCKKYEREAINNCDLNLTITPQDIELLKTNYNLRKNNIEHLGVFEYKKNNAIINNFHKPDYKFPVFIITGSLCTIQTEKSIDKWINLYYPLIQTSFPNHKLIIAGRYPSKQLYKICSFHKNIEIIPNPSTMDEILKLGDIYICPTSLGGGLKLRIMDGLRYGMPVITHIISARGYEPFVEKKLVLTYDNIISFNKAIKLIKDNIDKKKEIIESYHNYFSFENGIKHLKYILIKHNLI